MYGYFDLDWEDYILIDPTLLKKGDPISIISDPRKINQEHNWKTKVSLDSLLEKCIQFKLKNFKLLTGTLFFLTQSAKYFCSLL